MSHREGSDSPEEEMEKVDPVADLARMIYRSKDRAHSEPPYQRRMEIGLIVGTYVALLSTSIFGIVYSVVYFANGSTLPFMLGFLAGLGTWIEAAAVYKSSDHEETGKSLLIASGALTALWIALYAFLVFIAIIGAGIAGE